MGLYRKEPADFRKKFDVVGAFVSNEADQILMLKRHPDKIEGGRWGVPAGKVEDGERRNKAMCRELYQESGIAVDEERLSFFGTVFVRYPQTFGNGIDLAYHIYLLRVSKPPVIKLSPEEHIEYKWCTPREALDLDLMYEEDKCIQIVFFPALFAANAY